MLVTFQFPIADARAFDGDGDLRLAVPDWPDPATQIRPQFIHHFGRAVDRNLEADEAWPDEIKFCRVRRAIRLAQRVRDPNPAAVGHGHSDCAFRRLFCDGRAVVRVEVGLRAWAGGAAEAVLAKVSELCDLPTDVPVVGETPERNKLLRQGVALADLYARATLPTTSVVKADRAAALVGAGNPIVLCDLNAWESPEPLSPPGFTAVPVEHTRGANLAFGRLRTWAGVIGVWILQRGAATYADVRSLRICLLRLHAEQEVLDLILKFIQRKTLLNPPTDQSVNALDEYFNERTRLINRTYLQGIKQSAIREALNAAEQVTPPASRQNLANRYDGARKQVWDKINKYQQDRAAQRQVTVVQVLPGGIDMSKNVTVTGGTGVNINVADYMKDVVSTVNNNLQKSSAGNDVKALIDELAKHMQAIAPKADPEQTQKLGKNLLALTNEIAQPQPDRAWYQLSLKGMKEAAEAIGEIAAPITSVITKLMGLLAIV